MIEPISGYDRLSNKNFWCLLCIWSQDLFTKSFSSGHWNVSRLLATFRKWIGEDAELRLGTDSSNKLNSRYASNLWRSYCRSIPSFLASLPRPPAAPEIQVSRLCCLNHQAKLFVSINLANLLITHVKIILSLLCKVWVFFSTKSWFENKILLLTMLLTSPRTP